MAKIFACITDSRTEDISACVDSILKPHMEYLPLFVKDTSDLINKFHNLKGKPQTAFW